ncbi:DUF262 domain-containing protein [Candidatus Roizmanbacteria bacterium]|nr:DUF262 domain-containing protein [Candidatus Roizmanbacteria bacterium]
MTNPTDDDKALPTITETEVEDWFESEETQPVDTTPAKDVVTKYAESQLRIVRTTIDFSLHTLRTSLSDSSYINMSPVYQRRNRWDIIKRSRLIESFLMNIPIPPLFLFENDYNQYEVMDGRQRLEAIQSFLKNDYPLRELEFWKELNDHRFRDLPETIQRGLLRRTISAIVLLAETTRKSESSEDIDVRMVLFRRLNTGGIKLNTQEIRNALYPSEFNRMVRRVARHSLFTSLWGIPAHTPNEENDPPAKLMRNTLYKTMADSELVLRFFAIKETIEMDLKGSLRRILDNCMERHQKDSPEAVIALENLFITSLTKLSKAFAENPFRLPNTGRLSRPLYDALTVAISLIPEFNTEQPIGDLQLRLNNALADEDLYEILIGRGNTVEAIKDRVREAKRILKGE